MDDEFNSGNFQFIAFRNNLVKSDLFKEFWENINNVSLKNKNYENYTINYFDKLGFKWKNYLEIINNFQLNEPRPFFSIFDVNNLISNYELPLINIKPFTLSKKIHLYYHNGLDLSLAMSFLNNSDYDTYLIYEYLLNIMDPGELVTLLNFKKIIPTQNFNFDYKSDKSIVVIAHLYYDDLLDYDFKFLNNIPEYIDIIITTDESHKKKLIESLSNKETVQ